MEKKDKLIKDDLSKSILKTILMLLALAIIGFVLSYAILALFKYILHLSNHYTSFEYIYTEGTLNKSFSSTKLSVLIQSILYTICLFGMFIVALRFYFKKYYLSEKDTLLYSLFIILIIFSSSFILINLTINYLNDIIKEFNEMIITYNLNAFDPYLKKLSILRIVIVFIYSIGAIGTTIMSLLIIKNNKQKPEISKKEEPIKEISTESKEISIPVEEEKVEEIKEENKVVEQPIVETVSPVVEQSKVQEQPPVIEQQKVTEPTKVVEQPQEVVDINKELDEEEKRIVNEINSLIDKESQLDENIKKVELPKERKKKPKKINFVGQKK